MAAPFTLAQHIPKAVSTPEVGTSSACCTPGGLCSRILRRSVPRLSDFGSGKVKGGPNPRSWCASWVASGAMSSRALQSRRNGAFGPHRNCSQFQTCTHRERPRLRPRHHAVPREQSCSTTWPSDPMVRKARPSKTARYPRPWQRTGAGQGSARIRNFGSEFHESRAIVQGP